jgi:hypothetical protein
MSENGRENDLFQLLLLSSHSQWVKSLHALNYYLVAIPPDRAGVTESGL